MANGIGNEKALALALLLGDGAKKTAPRRKMKNLFTQLMEDDRAFEDYMEYQKKKNKEKEKKKGIEPLHLLIFMISLQPVMLVGVATILWKMFT